MADSTVLNNWYPTEFVDVPAMKSINSVLLSNLFATAKPGTILGIVPTISPSPMTFSTTAGYAFFGVTTNATYIANTGSTTAGCTVEARGAIPLANLNCYIYIKPIFTVSGGLAPLTTISGEVYSSVNASDVGIKICQVVNGIPTNFNKNNIADYLTSLDNTLTLRSPDGSGQNLDVSGSLSVTGLTYLNNNVNISNNLIVNQSLTVNNGAAIAGNVVINKNNGVTLISIANTTSNTMDLLARQLSTSNYSQLLASIDIPTNTALVQLNTATNSVVQYSLSLANSSRPRIDTGGTGNIFNTPTANDIVVGYNLPKTAQYTVTDTANNQWVLTCTTLSGGDYIYASVIQIYGVCTSFSSGSGTATIELFPLGFVSPATANSSTALNVSYFGIAPTLSTRWEAGIPVASSNIIWATGSVPPAFSGGIASFQILYLKA